MSGSSEEALDFFTDRSFIADPCPYFDRLREGWPCSAIPQRSQPSVKQRASMMSSLPLPLGKSPGCART
jgi:hypothetical protein